MVTWINGPIQADLPEIFVSSIVGPNGSQTFVSVSSCIALYTYNLCVWLSLISLLFDFHYKMQEKGSLRGGRRFLLCPHVFEFLLRLTWAVPGPGLARWQLGW